jgi:hypothetical protein
LELPGVKAAQAREGTIVTSFMDKNLCETLHLFRVDDLLEGNASSP